MARSLRFRLPALFLLAILLAGLLAAAISLRLFQNHVHAESLRDLRREAAGIAELYAESALQAADEGRNAPQFAAAKLEAATGNRLFYVGASVFPGQESGLTRLSVGAADPRLRSIEQPLTFEFTPPGESRVHIAAAQPLRLDPDSDPFGALVVAKPRTELREQWSPLVERLALGFLIAIPLAWLLFWWLSRRITGPVHDLSLAFDEIARGNYAVRVEERGGTDEVGKLSAQFNDMAARLGEAERREREFLMSVSHELRTPLTAIHGHVDALLDGLVSDPEDVRASLEIMSDETVRLERLVGDVLDLAKLNAHRFTVQAEEVDMGRLVEHAYNAFGEEARRRSIDYRLQANGAAPTIVTDGDRVLQVITNLLANAFRWTDDGGTIELELGRSDAAVEVTVADTGPGVAPEDRDRIFSPFVSTDTDGTGLGLPIAREIALALGGRVELESEVGAGSRFRLVLPAATTPPL